MIIVAQDGVNATTELKFRIRQERYYILEDLEGNQFGVFTRLDIAKRALNEIILSSLDEKNKIYHVKPNNFYQL